MRTYILIGCLAVLGNLQIQKVSSSPEPDPDLYLAYEEEEGSGDPDVPPLGAPSHASHPPLDAERGRHHDDDEMGSGMRPDSKGGGAPPDEDAEADEDYYDDYDSTDKEDRESMLSYHDQAFRRNNALEGSGAGGYYPTHLENHNDDDIRIPFDQPKEEVYEEIHLEHGPSNDRSPDRMPTSTHPPTLTDQHPDMDNNNIRILTQKDDERQVSIFAQPGILAAFIGGAVMGLLCAILLVMFIVYRMRKRDEGSYPLDEPKRVPLTSSYSPNDKEIYA